MIEYLIFFGIINNIYKAGDNMIVENTESMKKLQNVVATMAIENMYLSKEFVEELIKVSNGEKTSEELRQEVIKKYVR